MIETLNYASNSLETMAFINHLYQTKVICIPEDVGDSLYVQNWIHMYVWPTQIKRLKYRRLRYISRSFRPYLMATVNSGKYLLQIYMEGNWIVASKEKDGEGNGRCQYYNWYKRISLLFSCFSSFQGKWTRNEKLIALIRELICNNLMALHRRKKTQTFVDLKTIVNLFQS